MAWLFLCLLSRGCRGAPVQRVLKRLALLLSRGCRGAHKKWGDITLDALLSRGYRGAPESNSDFPLQINPLHESVEKTFVLISFCKTLIVKDNFLGEKSKVHGIAFFFSTA